MSQPLASQLAPLPGQSLRLPAGRRSPGLGGGLHWKLDAEKFVPRSRKTLLVTGPIPSPSTPIEINLTAVKLILIGVVRTSRLLGANLGVSLFHLAPPSGARVFVPPRGFGALASEGGLD